MGWRRVLRGGGTVGAAALLACWFPLAAQAATKVAFTVSDSRITESSGMARDTAGGLYWTVNDSGATGVVYGVGSNGKVKGTLNYRAEPTDVEAVALNQDRLYVADIGDNDEKRDHVTVYYFDQPRAIGLTVSYKAWDLRYPDGPHDAETLLVTSKGRLYIATKGATGHLYRAPAKPSRDGINELTKVGADLPAMITDGVIMPGGKQIALLTYGQVIMVDATSGKKLASTDLSGPKQAESLAVSLDGTALMVGSEGKSSKVYTLPVPAAASASPSSSASDQGADVPDDTSDSAVPAERGTLMALGVAALVAVVAGVVVGVVRRG